MAWADQSSDVQCAVAYSLPSDLTTESIEFLADYKADLPLIEANGGDDAMMRSNFYMATYLMGYGYIAEHTEGDPLGGEPDDELLEAEEFMSPFYQVNSDTPPLYLIHGEKDEAVGIHHAYAMELAGKMYMDEGTVETAYWPEAGHVDKKYFDSYAQYVATYEFVQNVLEGN